MVKIKFEFFKVRNQLLFTKIKKKIIYFRIVT